MATVDEIMALGVGGEIVNGLRAGAKYITVEAHDMARALADAYQCGLRKGEDLERTRCIGIAQHATVPPYSFQIHPDIPYEKCSRCDHRWGDHWDEGPCAMMSFHGQTEECPCSGMVRQSDKAQTQERKVSDA